MRALAALCLLLLVGCSKPVPAGFSEASKQTIQSFLFDQGIPTESCIVPDQNYALPSRGWMEQFGYRLLDEQRRRGIDRSHFHSPELNCNKFARFAAAYASECWLKDPARISGKAIAVGEVIYSIDEREGHAVTVAILREAERLQLVFQEPQTGRFCQVTPAQIKLGIFIF